MRLTVQKVWDSPSITSFKSQERGSPRRLLSFLSPARYRRSRLHWMRLRLMTNLSPASLGLGSLGPRDLVLGSAMCQKQNGMRMCGWPASLLHQKPDASDDALKLFHALSLFQYTVYSSQNPPLGGRIYCATVAFKSPSPYPF